MIGNNPFYPQKKFPTDKEVRHLTDYCEHEGLHKACGPCTEDIERFVELVIPLMTNRIYTAQLQERMLW